MDAHERPGAGDTEGMGGEAEESLTREALPGGPAPERWRAAQRRALRVLTGLAAAGLLAVLTMSGVVPRLLGGTVAPGAAAGDAARATARAADATRAAQAQSDLSLGWRVAGPRWAEALVFAPGAPRTAYTCGVPDNPGGFGYIAVLASSDGGRSWAERPTPAEDQVCDVTVNPTDARDVVLATTSLVATGGEAPVRLYRSDDGGATWRAFPLPPRGPRDAEIPVAFQWAWVGGMLYVAPYYMGDRGYFRLAASAGGAPLRWLDTAPLLEGFGPGASINRLYTGVRSLYVEVGRAQPCTERCFGVRRTTDGGATWADFAPAVDGHPLTLVGGQPDGAVLFAQYDLTPDEAERRYVRSTDDGTTWVTLPPLPQGLFALDMLQAPDGDVYAAIWSFGAPSPDAEEGIYVLRANERVWRLAAPYPQAGGGPLIVSWDAQGRPSALWANASAPSNQAPALGLERHGP